MAETTKNHTTDPAQAPPEPARRATSEPTQSYWDIVLEQFRKYRLSYYALWAVVALFLLAVYAPVVASDLPFTMTIDGQRTWPWFANLFNKNYYENTVDILFNSLVGLLPLSALIYAAVAHHMRNAPQAMRRQAKGRVVILALVAVVLANLWLLVDPLPRMQGVNGETQRPESELARLFGWYESEFPQPKEDLRRAKKAGLQTDATFPFVEYSFRGTSEQISSPPSIFGVTMAHAINKTAVLTGNAEGMFRHSQQGVWSRPLGTDPIGRDVFARMVFGTRVALTIGVVAVTIYIFIGVFLGALAGYFGGWVDLLILRFIEIMLCFPSLFLIMTLAAFVEEPSIFYVMLIIGLTRWTTPARLVRGEFLRLRNEEFVQAAKALGLPEWRIIFRHILPNALGPVLVTATFGVASAILIESTISFLGLGDPSAPTWGGILNDGRVFRNNIMILLPGLAIFATVSLFNLMGEGLRDALDPKLRR